jgi:hypothetical protein
LQYCCIVVFEHFMLEWVVIGGGIHGCYLASYLIGNQNVPADSIRIVDPNSELLYEWLHCTHNVGMRYLRSPGVHHIDPEDPFSLLRFARTPEGKRVGRLLEPYRRPSYQLFNRHAQKNIARHKLDSIHLRARVSGIKRKDNFLEIMAGSNCLLAKRVALCIGMDQQLHIPDFALPYYGQQLHHVFDTQYRLIPERLPEDIFVVGGGISAVQTAMRVADSSKGRRKVRLLSKEPLRTAMFDSDPGWMGPLFIQHFLKNPCPVHRRTIIKSARNSGSMPPEMLRRFQSFIAQGRIGYVQDNIQQMLPMEGGKRWKLEGQKSIYNTELLLLATGFDRHRPGGEWLSQLIAHLNLPIAPCGFPLTEADLHWGHGIYVSGALAELTLGPPARNIIGARHAAPLIAASMHKSPLANMC